MSRCDEYFLSSVSGPITSIYNVVASGELWKYFTAFSLPLLLMQVAGGGVDGTQGEERASAVPRYQL